MVKLPKAKNKRGNLQSSQRKHVLYRRVLMEARGHRENLKNAERKI